MVAPVAPLAYQGFIPPSVYPFAQTAATFTRALNVYPPNVPVGVVPNFAPGIPRAVIPNGIPAFAPGFPTAYAAGVPVGASPYGLEARSIHAVAPGVVPAGPFLQGAPGLVRSPGPFGFAAGPPQAIASGVAPGGAVLQTASGVIPAL